MHCKVWKTDGKSAVVVYKEDSRWQGCIIPVSHIGYTRLLEMVDIPDDVVLGGIEYGVDMTVVLPESLVIAEEIQQALRVHGLWTAEDISNNRNKLVDAMIDVARLLAVRVVRSVFTSVGG